MQYISI